MGKAVCDGIDKTDGCQDRRSPCTSKRMNRPLSAEAFHDEASGPMAFLDSYLIDTYEVAENKDYGNSFVPSYIPRRPSWDDPRLNTPRQPVVGVNGIDAKSCCEFRGSAFRQARVEGDPRANGNLYPWQRCPIPIWPTMIDIK